MPSMSNPATILDQCRRLGLQVWAEGDRIGIAPKGSILADLRDQIRVAKPVLLPLLRESVGLPSGCAPWLHIAKQVLAGEFTGCDRSTRASLSIGLRNVAHPLCRRALSGLGENPTRP